MKFNELKQAMDWRRRVGFNGGGYVKKKVLPQPKPKEEAEKVNKARKEKTFKEAKPALENPKEVKEMIDKPKRGLVDEPGSYSLSEKALKNIKEFEKRTGLKYEEINDRMKKRVREGDKTVGRNLLVKKFEESKEGQKIIKDFEKRTGRVYAEEPPGLRKSVRDKTFAFSENIPTDDPKRLKAIKDYIKSVKKEFGYNPTKQELRNYFKKTTGKDYTNVIAKIAKEIDLPSGKDQSAAKAVDRDVKKLLKSKTITNTLNKGKFPTDSQIRSILKVDPTIAETRAMDLADTLTGNRVIRLFNAPTKYKQLAKDYIDINSRDGFGTKGSRARRGYEKALTQLLDLPKGIANIRRDILNKIGNFIPELKGKLAVDEIASITSSMRRGSGPYAIFAQVLGSDFNSEVKGGRVDSQKGNLEKKLVNLAKDDPERIRLQQIYNNQINKFELEANKNNPIKKVKGLKLSFEPPSKTVKNKKVYNQYKDLFDAHYNKYGYSFEVPADRDSIVDISKKLDNKAFQNTIKNRFTKLIGKGGKFGALVGLGTLAGTGFALADQPGVQEATSVLPTAAAAGTGAAAVGTKTGRNILGKIFRGAGTPLAGPVFAATNVASKMGEGQSFADAVVDPLTGLELSFPGLFKENISKITKSPTLQKVLGLGRFGRMLTPVGLGLATLGQAQEFYNQRQNLQRMREQNPRAYSEFMSRRVAPALSTAEQTAIEDMGRFGAAGGGIMKMAGKSSGRPPESGPTPQGLDFLLKRGR